MSARPVRIIGGGLAGLSLGISLRNRGIPVTVFEAGSYPRHRVCGEFINGRGLGSLERLGLRALLRESGAIEARTARFFIGCQASPRRKLPQPALCISRHRLDARLASAFRDLGGELATDTRRAEPIDSEGTVRASGRRLMSVDNGWRWFGLKIHARGTPLTADLEIHAQQNGYVGICQLGSGEANICGVFRRRANAAGREDWRDLLRGNEGSFLRERLSRAAFLEETFCAVAGLSLLPKSARAIPECCIGDAITMTPPVTGNGMSMAFEAAEIALEPLSRYSCGELGWDEARKRIACECDAAFRSRLRWSHVLQWLMFSRLARGPVGSVLLNSQTAWTWFYSHTR